MPHGKRASIARAAVDAWAFERAWVARPAPNMKASKHDYMSSRNMRLLFGAIQKRVPCLVTLQRKNKAYGCFAGGRFGPRDGTEITDEIALNPSHFKSRTGE